MIKQLSIYRFLLIALAAALSFNAKAQFPLTIPTPYAPTGNYVTPAYAQPQFITFQVENTNAYPVRLTSVGFYHVVGPLSNGSSMNGATYTLWYQSPAGGGPPTIAPANGWNIIATGAPISPASNGIVDVVSGMDFIIPPAGCAGNIVRFALVCSDTMWHSYQTTGPWTPGVITNTGVKLFATSQYVGVFPGSSVFILDNTPTGNPPVSTWTPFRGSISVDTNGITPPPPTVSVDKNPVCVKDSVTLMASITPEVECAFPDPEFEWTWAGGGYAKGDTIRVEVSETTQYNCTVTSKGKKSPPASVKVVVVDPEPPLVSGKFQYCVGDQFEPLEVHADSVRWYYVDTGGSALPVTPTINTNLGPQHDTFYVSQWKDGCFSKRTRVVLTAAIKPGKPIVTTPLYYCEGQPAPPLEAIGNEMLWYYFPSGGVPTTIAPTPPTSVRNKFEYFVANTNDGCEGPRERIEVFVEFKPNGLIVPSRDRLCEGDTITLQYYGSAFDSSAFDWKIPEAGVSVGDTNLQKGPFIVRFDKAGTYDITLVVGSGACFSDLYSQPFQVDSIPFAIITAKEEVCADAMELVSLEYYDETIDTFKWDFGAGGRTTHFATDQGPYGVIWDTPGESVIALTLIQGFCADTLYDSIHVRPHPDARIDIDEQSLSPTGIYCAGDSIRVRAHTINSGTEYTWGPNRYFDTYASLPAAYAIVDYTSYVTLNVEDQFGCMHSDSVLVKTEPCCKLTFPSAFSPNNDTKNDRFHLLNVRDGNMANYHHANALNYDVKNFRVMNRWGVTVFESNNEIAGWDGNFNGEPQDMGTYYWFISYMCGDKLMNEKGEVVLVR